MRSYCEQEAFAQAVGEEHYRQGFVHFKERQKCDFLFVDRGDLGEKLYLFASGAISDGNLRHEPPPSDPRERLSRQGAYLQEKLSRAELHFQQCRDFIQTQSHYHKLGAGPMPSERNFNDLEGFKKAIVDLRTSWTNAAVAMTP